MSLANRFDRVEGERSLRKLCSLLIADRGVASEGGWLVNSEEMIFFSLTAHTQLVQVKSIKLDQAYDACKGHCWVG